MPTLIPEAVLPTPPEHRYRTAQSELTLDIYETAKDTNPGWRTQGVLDDAFYAGAQWDKGDIANLKKSKEAPMTHNVVGPAMDLKIALMTSNAPRIQATAREDSDVGMSRVSTQVLAWLWEQNRGNQQLKQALHHYCHRGGRGVLFAWWDPNKDFGKGDVCFRAEEDPLTVFPDASSKDRLWQDAPHVVFERVMTYEQAMAMYPDKKGIIQEAQPYEDSSLPGHNRSTNDVADGDYTPPLSRELKDHNKTHFQILDRYSKITQTFHRVHHSATGRERVFSEDDYNEWLVSGRVYIHDEGDRDRMALFGEEFNEMEKMYGQLREALGAEDGEPVAYHLQLTTGPDGQPGVSIAPGYENEESQPGSSVIIAPIAPQEIMDQEEVSESTYMQPRIRNVAVIGQLQLYDQVLPYSSYPFVPINNIFNGNIWTQSDISRVRMIQQEINFTEQKIIRSLSKQTGTKIIRPNNFWADEEEAAKKLSSPGTEDIAANWESLMDGAGLQVITPVALANENILHVERLIGRIDRILGLYEWAQGGGGGQMDTVRGALFQNEAMQRRIRSATNDVDQALVQFGKVLLEMAQVHYTREKVIRVVQPWGEVEETKINEKLYDNFGRQIGVFNDITVGSYDVTIVAGSTLPVPRWQLAEYYERLAVAGIIPKEEFWRKSELFDVERMMETESTTAQLQQALAAAEEKVKELEGLNERQDHEIRHKDRQVSKAKTQEQLSRVANREERDQQVAQSRLKDIVKNLERHVQENANTTTDAS